MTQRPPPQAILFDLDGTLIDTWRLYLECFRQTVQPWLGRAPADEEILARHPSSERRFLREWVGEAGAEQAHAAFGRNYQALFGGLSEGPYPGVREMLSALRSAGYPLGVVTGKGRHAWEVTEAALGLGPFAVVVTDDDVAEPKPAPEGLLAAARALGIAAERVVYVGDSLADMRAGDAAGMRTAAALWPKTADGEAERFLNRLQSRAPDWAFARPDELTRTFAGWC